MVVHETVEKEYGRIELRRYVLSDNLEWLDQKAEWMGLRAVGRVESTRIVSGQTTTEHRYYLSTVMDLERFAEVVRRHWAIENCQHCVLDVQFGEDANRARKNFSAQNLALVRRMASNVFATTAPPKTASACANSGPRSTTITGSN
ncbi:hypothetical protein CCP3SC5AM1_730016 [Gammaproteobacteria bacterium]